MRSGTLVAVVLTGAGPETSLRTGPDVCAEAFPGPRQWS